MIEGDVFEVPPCQGLDERRRRRGRAVDEHAHAALDVRHRVVGRHRPRHPGGHRLVSGCHGEQPVALQARTWTVWSLVTNPRGSDARVRERAQQRAVDLHLVVRRAGRPVPLQHGTLEEDPGTRRRPRSEQGEAPARRSGYHSSSPLHFGLVRLRFAGPLRPGGHLERGSD